MVYRLDNRKDILLLMLYSPGRTGQFNEPIYGRTRLLKMLFVFKEEALDHFRRGTNITPETFYQFFPWRFGPFSREVYDDLTFFELHGFIEPKATSEEILPESVEEWEAWLSMSRQDSSGDVSEYEEQEYRLSEKGLRFAKGLYETLSGEQRNLLREFKTRLSVVPLKGLLKYVYEKYESMTTNSEIKEQVLGKRHPA